MKGNWSKLLLSYKKNFENLTQSLLPVCTGIVHVNIGLSSSFCGQHANHWVEWAQAEEHFHLCYNIYFIGLFTDTNLWEYVCHKKFISHVTKVTFAKCFAKINNFCCKFCDIFMLGVWQMANVDPNCRSHTLLSNSVPHFHESKGSLDNDCYQSWHFEPHFGTFTFQERS